MTIVPPFPEGHLRAICDVLGDTNGGLTNAEITILLQQCRIYDSATKRTRNGLLGEAKRERLYRVLRSRQEQDRSANNVVAFVKASMAPVRYTRNLQLFHDRCDQLNEVLAFAGYEVGEDGEVRPETTARTVDEAVGRAGRLRSELARRGVHPDVLQFCRSELVKENYFHAVLEATKSVADKIRGKTGLTADGSQLVEQAFGLEHSPHPILAFNSLRTPTERSEHVGLSNLMKGLFGAFRNVTAHAPKIYWPMEERDALDVLTLASLIHRRLDSAALTGRSQSQELCGRATIGVKDAGAKLRFPIAHGAPKRRVPMR